ncbi:hypothetical protein ACIRP2_15315 [Streptomyces sp. NPDC101194]
MPRLSGILAVAVGLVVGAALTQPRITTRPTARACCAVDEAGVMPDRV